MGLGIRVSGFEFGCTLEPAIDKAASHRLVFSISASQKALQKAFIWDTSRCSSRAKAA